MSAARNQPQRARLEKLRKVFGGLSISQPISEQRATFTRMMAMTEIAMPEHREDALELGGVQALRIRPFERTPHEQTILYLHGGGYIMGAPSTHRCLAARIADRCCVELILPDYRLAPEHPCPAALEDARAAWLALPEATRRHAIVGGDSAGGGLALALAMELRERGEPLPRGLLLLSPWVDLSMSTASIDSMAEHEVMLQRPRLEYAAGHYAGELDRRQWRVSPLFGDFTGLPPTLIQVGGHDVLLDEAGAATRAAEAAGVEVSLEVFEEQAHVFQSNPLLAATSRAVGKIDDWLATRRAS
ncbi:alpha/beta hydrolase [Pseudenhygromyxa sp. WMMC2535]|uniref:alpha/beta hydrolase n=1 Tax=Pseudenhygromyxa sp. WMMC2535 TaxID=2712867 RepID=UPI001557385E|nr:alpha/beta hydrolase [Pseudenhygromyxa sp. WMMC2535]NVB43389.1 alpha/beta hydrolase [Pseudenhygromyxa sp. WMMC2535]